MTSQEKELAFYKNAATQGRTGKAPQFIPSRVFLVKRIHGDPPFFTSTFAGPGVMDCSCNKWGAVSVIAENGKDLDLRLDEFEVISWGENPDF